MLRASATSATCDCDHTVSRGGRVNEDEDGDEDEDEDNEDGSDTVKRIRYLNTAIEFTASGLSGSGDWPNGMDDLCMERS